MLAQALDVLFLEGDVAVDHVVGKDAAGGEEAAVRVEGVEHPRQLLLAVHDIIHVEVKKLMEGATPPNLYYDDVDGDPDKLIIHYESKRGLCMLMEGLLDGVAEHFGMEITYEQTSCTHRGDPRCTFEIQFQHAMQA